VSAGQIQGIACKSGTRAPIEIMDAAQITEVYGLEGDHRGSRAKGGGERQITILSEEDWNAACAELDADLPWTFRRANLLVSDVELYDKAGCRLVIGDVILEITGECEPCQRMDEQYEGLREALEPRWRAGANCRVLKGGQISVGDSVSLSRVQ